MRDPVDTGRIWLCGLTAAASLTACAANGSNMSQTSTTPTSRATPALSATAAQGPRPEKWIDLQAGECLAEPPPTDPSVLDVTVVDCAARHLAEVYARAPVALNAAVADVAHQQCAAKFLQYTGHPLDGSAFTVTYLIDSNQDRTADNPNPSTVICALQAADGQPMTGSARR